MEDDEFYMSDEFDYLVDVAAWSVAILFMLVVSINIVVWIINL